MCTTFMAKSHLSSHPIPSAEVKFVGENCENKCQLEMAGRECDARCDDNETDEKVHLFCSR